MSLDEKEIEELEAKDEELEGGATFWDHLDALRSSLMKIVVVTLLCGIVAFTFKDELFYVLLAPTNGSFITFRLMGAEDFHINLVNIQLTEQFMMHMKAAFSVGFLVALPYIIYILYKFVAPALYEKEKKAATAIVSSAYVMFMLGVLINYFLIYPITVRFLGTYSVSDSVNNMLSLESYMDTLVMMSIVFGVIFEIPIISFILGKMGLLKPDWMINYRRHATVAILIIAAVITPTGDMFTLIIVSLPIWLLYELSIRLVKMAAPKQIENN